MKKRQLMILTVFVGGLTDSIPVIKAQEWRLMSREEIEAKVHPVLLEQAGEFLHFDTCRLSVGTINEKSQPKTVYFRFQNVSQQTITLNKVTTTWQYQKSTDFPKGVKTELTEQIKVNAEFQYPENCKNGK